MKKVIVTGASGFIGVNLCKVLNENKVKTYALLRDGRSYGEELESLGCVEPVICGLEDIGLLPQLIPESNIDAVYHLAWGGVSGEERGDYGIQLKNIQFTLGLISAASKIGCRRFVGVGSTAEFDAYNACICDGVSPDIASLYGTSKMAAHFMSKALCRELGMEHVWGIIGNTYGVGDKSRNFINFAAGLIRSEEEAKFTSGEQAYDFVYVTDAAQALYCLGVNGKDKSSYYIGSGNPRKLKDYIITLRNLLNPSKELRLGAVPYNGVSTQMDAFSVEKTQRETGYIPKISFEKGIKMIYRSDVCGGGG